MKWKEIPYWLKGGMVSIFVLLILILASTVRGKTSDMGNIFDWILIIISLPIILVVQKINNGISLIFFELIYFFAIGSIIGYAYGKIKCWLKK